MTISHLFSLLGGLGLFLYGMWMMREHLQAAAGNRIKEILETLTATPVRGFLAGIGITAMVQSSSAVMVLLVGLADAGTISLVQAVWVILGANIGTTITGQLIALQAEGAAPLLAFVGILLMLFAKKESRKCRGGILAGVGVLFLGLTMMSEAVLPLKETKWFLGLLTACKSPAAGIFMGALATAVIQSSSASIGILQTLAKGGLLELSQCVYLIFGQNMGTCVTGLLASAGAGRNAKRTAVIHLMVNVFGTLLFTGLLEFLPLCRWIGAAAPGDTAKQIAHVHTVFNLVTSLVCLPFGNLLVRISGYIVPERSKNHDYKK